MPYLVTQSQTDEASGLLKLYNFYLKHFFYKTYNFLDILPFSEHFIIPFYISISYLFPYMIVHIHMIIWVATNLENRENREMSGKM